MILNIAFFLPQCLKGVKHIVSKSFMSDLPKIKLDLTFHVVRTT